MSYFRKQCLARGLAKGECPVHARQHDCCSHLSQRKVNAAVNSCHAGLPTLREETLTSERGAAWVATSSICQEAVSSSLQGPFRGEQESVGPLPS